MFSSGLKGWLCLPICTAIGKLHTGVTCDVCDDCECCAAQGCLLGGFLSYKGALLLQIWEATKPRFEPEKLLRPARPSLPDLGDEADEAEWSNRINRG